MNEQEIEEYIRENDIQFIRLTFFDVFGEQRNIAIMPEQLKRAMKEGIPFDASAIPGFYSDENCDLFLEPDTSTMSIVPWRSLDGGVVRILCDITYPDGSPFTLDTRHMLKEAVKQAHSQGIDVEVGTEVEFYIFKTDENGEPTRIPHDNAGYFSVAPKDKGENIRRSICQMLRQMGIVPEASHHEKGPGQHEVDFRAGNPLQTADNTTTFRWIVENAIELSGCHADFSPKPLRDKPGNGMHIGISSDSTDDTIKYFMAGVMDHIREMTLFLNPGVNSYERLGTLEAPGYISWSKKSRLQLIRIPAQRSEIKRFELRSPDPLANTYLAYTLVILAGLDGVKKKSRLSDPVDFDLHNANADMIAKLGRLPVHLEEAIRCARESDFLKESIPQKIIDEYCNNRYV